MAAAFQPQSNLFGSNMETGFFLVKWNMIMWELMIAEKIEEIEEGNRIINITIQLSTLMETSDPIEEYCFD